MARPPRYTDKELRAIFREVRAKNLPMGDKAKQLRIREHCLRYHYRRLYGKTYRNFRRFEPSLRLPKTSSILAYMAGIIDGEGWISKSGRGAQVCFSNTFKPVVYYFATFGGLVSPRKMKTWGRIKSVKPQWYWKVTRAQDCLKLLRA